MNGTRRKKKGRRFLVSLLSKYFRPHFRKVSLPGSTARLVTRRPADVKVADMIPARARQQ